jgi:hypothetical protein
LYDSDSDSDSDYNDIPSLQSHNSSYDSDSDDSSNDEPSPLGNNHYSPLASLDSDSESENDSKPLLTRRQTTSIPPNNQSPNPRPTYPIFFPTDNAAITLPDVDSFHGDTLSMPKPDNCTRFLTKNIHHVSTNATDDKLRIHFGDQHQLEIDYFGITEHKLDTHQYKVRQSFIDSAHQSFTQHKLEIGSSELQTVSTYKPGGTAIIAQGDATGRVISQESDKYGRWSYLHLQGHANKVITYITAYQVCKKPTNPQGITAFHQQATAFSREKRKNTNPRHNFRHDLIKFIKGLQT